jgi:hypothetical protein
MMHKQLFDHEQDHLFMIKISNHRPLEQCSKMSSHFLPLPSGNAPSSKGNQSSSSFSFIDDEKTLCTQLQYGGFILEECQEQGFLYVSAVADLIDIEDDADAHCWSS